MALITCPECKKDVSDKVSTCPHCGYPLAEDRQEEQPASSPQQVEVVSVKVDTKKTKKILIGLGIAVVLIVVCVIAVIAAQRQNEAAARAAYIEDLWSARSTMLSGAAKAEGLCNLTKSVWYNTIHEERDIETDPYTREDGKFHDDFNDSLTALYISTDTQSTVTAIKKNQEEVAEIMRGLQNPPEGLDACFATIESMYDVYSSFTSLAVSPSGSYNTYSENFRTYDSGFMRLYEKLDTQIPDK